MSSLRWDNVGVCALVFAATSGSSLRTQSQSEQSCRASKQARTRANARGRDAGGGSGAGGGRWGGCGRGTAPPPRLPRGAGEKEGRNPAARTRAQRGRRRCVSLPLLLLRLRVCAQPSLPVPPPARGWRAMPARTRAGDGWGRWGWGRRAHLLRARCAARAIRGARGGWVAMAGKLWLLRLC